jgi:hypothetical protein
MIRDLTRFNLERVARISACSFLRGISCSNEGSFPASQSRRHGGCPRFRPAPSAGSEGLWHLRCATRHALPQFALHCRLRGELCRAYHPATGERAEARRVRRPSWSPQICIPLATILGGSYVQN